VALSDFERWVRLDREQNRVDAGKKATMNKENSAAKPATKEELAHRQAVVAKVLANAEKRVISPLTTADLIHQVREEREEAYERWTH
jgi:hypothetical protein